jgi:23S rRNA pseudouridine2604 synthase
MTTQKPPARSLGVPVRTSTGPTAAVKRAAAPAGTLTRVPGPTETIRLNKRMAERGLCSRREADDWIAKGWVKVNGQVATMGLQVKPSDRIEIDKKAEGQQATQVTILLNKPMGYVSGQAEDGHEPAVTLFTAQNRWRDDNARFFFHPSQLKGLAPAGRLDIDSIGLLVLTQDGRVARQLIGEDSVMEKEYLVRVSYLGTGEPLRGADERPGALRTIHENDPVTTNVQAVFPPALLARLRHGLSLDGQALKPAHVDWQNPEQLRFVLTEGKKRQIRRMCELVGLKVVGLKRVRIGRVMLGNLPVGQWRYLAPHERF